MHLFNRPAALICMALAATAARAEEAAFDFNIPAQPLSRVLEALATQTGLQPVYADHLVQGVNSPGVQGRYTLREAVAQALTGTKLAFQFTGEKTVAIKPAVASSAAGNEDAAAERRRSELLPEVVVTATKTERRKDEEPVHVTVITGEQIRQQDVKDLSDVLRKEAGIDIVRGTPTGVATVSIRGGNSADQRTQVLIDGQPADFLTTGTGGRTAIQLVDPANVERIEIARGAGSALYGPGAIGGVVNIITRRGRPDQPQSRIFAGYDGQQTKTVALASTGGNENVSYQFNAKWADSNGYKSSAVPVSGTRLHSLQNETWRDAALGGRVGYWFTDRNELAFTLNHLDSHNNSFGRPHTWTDVRNTVYGVESANWLRDDYLLTANLSYRDHSANNDFDSYFVFPGFMNTAQTETLKEKANKLTFEVKNQWDINPSNRLLLGLLYGKDTVDLQSLDPVTGMQNDVRFGAVRNNGLYIQDEIKASDRLFVTAGARWDSFNYNLHFIGYTTAPATTHNVNRQWNTANPRVALRYNLSGTTSLRGSAGTGFRAPDTAGLLGMQSVRSNPDLNAEKSVSYDIGVDQKLGANANLSVTAYLSTIRDAIAVTFLGGGVQFRNIGKVRNTGAEVELNDKFGDNWSLFANYTYNVSEVVESAGAIANLPGKGKKLNLSPLNKLSAGVLYTLPGRFTARLDGRYVSAQYQVNDMQNTAANRLPAYFVADAKLTWQLPMDKNSVELSLGARNLFDRRYATRDIGAYAEPRTIFVNAGARF